MKTSKLTIFSIVSCVIAFFMLLLDPGGPASIQAISTSVVCIFIFSAYTILLIKCNQTLFNLTMYQVYVFGGLLVSASLISLGLPMIEIVQDGFPNNTEVVLVIFYMCGMESNRFVFDKLKIIIPQQQIKLSQKREMYIAHSVVMIALLVSLYIFLKYSSPLILGVNRVDYWTNIIPDYLGISASIISQTFLFAIFIYFLNITQRKSIFIPALYILMYAIVAVVILGEKFSLFIAYSMMAFAFLAGFGLRINYSINTVLIMIAVTLTLLALVGINYIIDGNDFYFILIRAVLQSQLIWSVMNESSYVLIFGLDWTCYFSCNQASDGVEFISQRYMPADLFDGYKMTGAGLSGFMPALAILSWGFPLALIAHLLVSASLGFIQLKFLSSVKARSLLHTVIWWKIYFGSVILWTASKDIAINGIVGAFIILVIWKLVSSGLRRSEYIPNVSY